MRDKRPTVKGFTMEADGGNSRKERGGQDTVTGGHNEQNRLTGLEGRSPVSFGTKWWESLQAEVHLQNFKCKRIV